MPIFRPRRQCLPVDYADLRRRPLLLWLASYLIQQGPALVALVLAEAEAAAATTNCRRGFANRPR